MTKWKRQCHEVNLTHDQMIVLNKDGSLNLKIEPSLENKILELAKNDLKKITWGYKFTTGHIVALGILSISVYAAIIESWVFILGLVFAVAMIVKDKTVNTEKLVDLAMKDANFFEKVKEIEGWIFLIEEYKEKEYLVRPAEEDNDDESENNNEDEEDNLDDEEETEDNFIQDLANQVKSGEVDSKNAIVTAWVYKRVSDFLRLEKNAESDIIDISELPYPKKDIFYAILISVIWSEDDETLESMKNTALDLAYYQDNVGPKPLADTEEEQKRYAKFEVLVKKETQIIKERLDLVVKRKENPAFDSLLEVIGELATLPKSILDESENINEAEQENDKGFVKWVDKRVSDFGLCMEKNSSSGFDIIDTSELPHPKEEILDALIVSVILGEGIELGALNLAALDLANYQEGVGPKQLGVTGVSTPDMLGLGASISKYEQMNEKEKNALKNTFTGTEEEQKKYAKFEALVLKETQIITEKLELAEKLRESSDADRLKGVYALTNLPKSITG